MPIGQQNTHITNHFGSRIRAVVTHPSGRNDDLEIEHSETRNVPTAKGEVTITVYGADQEEYAEQRTLKSDLSVLIKKAPSGKPRIRRVKYGTLIQEIDDD